MSSSFDELAKALSKLQGEPLERIHLETHIYEDLKIQGDDWNDLVEIIDRRWKVSWKGFIPGRYILGEPGSPLLLEELARWSSGRRLRPLTVGHLALVIDRGAWFDPETSRDERASMQNPAASAIDAAGGNEDRSKQRKQAAALGRRFLASEISYMDLRQEIPMEVSDNDDLIDTLIDMIEHAPKRGGWFGVSEREWARSRAEILKAIEALERP